MNGNTAAAATSDGNNIRVMVVDDSAVIRGMTAKILESEPTISVVSSVGNGKMAVDNLARRKGVDVIVLDIEMPVMDGIQALPELLKVDPKIKIIMSSTFTTRNADISIKAMNAGAADYISKPSSPKEITDGGEFRRELLEKVKALGDAHRRQTGAATRTKTVVRGIPVPSLSPTEPIKLRRPGIGKPRVLAIGSSTGGPQALFTFLKGLSPNIGVPVVITQHMPETFTAILAGHIQRSTDWPCSEAKEGDVLEPGKILLAPGGYHMTIAGENGKKVVRLNRNPPVNFCRPAVDPMLNSLANVYKNNILVVILTGMGADGMKGSQKIVAGGGTVIAQDEDTSVVWGMPGAVATAGLCSAVVPLEEMAETVTKSLSRAF
jgi:two-component system chemotaxis response regulator CheB